MTRRRGPWCLLALGGPVSDQQWLARRVRARRPKPVLVAANGGARHLSALGLAPHIRIGDFDSADPFVPAAQQFVRASPEKDQTDFELAMEYIHRVYEVRETWVIGALGGRVDASWVAVDVAARFARMGHDVTLLDHAYCLRFALPSRSVTLERGHYRYVSLLPWTPSVRGITTRGLRYPLSDGALRRGYGRGQSNVVVGQRARVKVGHGLLIVAQVVE